MSYCCVGLFGAKNPINVGAVLRAAFAFDVATVFAQGSRYKRVGTDTCAGYRHLPLVEVDDLLSVIPFACVPIAVELHPDAKRLQTYPHPPNAYYIFGPEDGSVPERIRTRCRDTIVLPGRTCLNLAAAVNIVLYDRTVKRGIELKSPPGLSARG